MIYPESNIQARQLKNKLQTLQANEVNDECKRVPSERNNTPLPHISVEKEVACWTDEMVESLKRCHQFAENKRKVDERAPLYQQTMWNEGKAIYPDSHLQLKQLTNKIQTFTSNELIEEWESVNGEIDNIPAPSMSKATCRWTPMMIDQLVKCRRSAEKKKDDSSRNVAKEMYIDWTMLNPDATLSEKQLNKYISLKGSSVLLCHEKKSLHNNANNTNMPSASVYL